MGSVRKQLMMQFLVESMLLTAFSMLIAFLLVFLLLPYFNSVAGKHLSFFEFSNVQALAGMAGLTFVVGFIAGIYPAFFLSSFNTIKVLRGTGAVEGGRRSLLRSGLVVFQFVVSIALI